MSVLVSFEITAHFSYFQTDVSQLRKQILYIEIYEAVFQIF